jgi:FkbM family methyltransferase
MAHIAEEGQLNPLSLRIWRALSAARSWTTVLHVGANDEELIQRVALPIGARAFAFEPAPSDALRLPTSGAPANAHVEIIEKAFRGATGSANLSPDPSRSEETSAAPLHPQTERESRSVRMARLDDALVAKGLRAHERYLVKLDVEGGERQVLEGFVPLLSSAESAALQVEVIHASEEDLQWMIAHFFFHLVSQTGLVPVPVATVDDYWRLLVSGCFHELDAVLSTQLLEHSL